MSNLTWLTPVLVAAVVVFFVDLACSFATSSSRVLNAVVQAVLFAIVAGLIAAYFTVGAISIAPVTP